MKPNEARILEATGLYEIQSQEENHPLNLIPLMTPLGSNVRVNSIRL